jgi:hypothetical protein
MGPEPVWMTWRREYSLLYWDSNSVVQSAVNRYTDCAIPAAMFTVDICVCGYVRSIVKDSQRARQPLINKFSNDRGFVYPACIFLHNIVKAV